MYRAYILSGNGWAAAGMLRVLATIRNSLFAQKMKDQQGDLTDWIEEIHDGMYAVLVRLFIFAHCFAAFYNQD